MCRAFRQLQTAVCTPPLAREPGDAAFPTLKECDRGYPLYALEEETGRGKQGKRVKHGRYKETYYTYCDTYCDISIAVGINRRPLPTPFNPGPQNYYK